RRDPPAGRPGARPFRLLMSRIGRGMSRRNVVPEPAVALRSTSARGEPVRALITGGAGFVGSHLVDRLLLNGDEVWLLHDLSTGSFETVRPYLERPGFHFVEGSILQRSLIEELASPCDTIFHLAAAVGVRRIMEQPRSSIEINLRGTEHVLAAARPGQHRV